MMEVLPANKEPKMPPKKQPYRLNLSMSSWCHRKLRVMAAESMNTMRDTIEAGTLLLNSLPEEERDIWYEKAYELTKKEKQAKLREQREAKAAK